MERVVQIMDEVDELLVLASAAVSPSARRLVISALLLFAATAVLVAL